MKTIKPKITIYISPAEMQDFWQRAELDGFSRLTQWFLWLAKNRVNEFKHDNNSMKVEL